MKKRFINNNGSTLVTVIVVVAFLTIITTTLLNVTGTNFLMKMNDINTDESFYEAETGLEEIKVGFASYVAESAKEARDYIIINYGKANAAVRDQLYQDKFYEILNKKLAKREEVINPDHSTPHVADYTLLLKDMTGDKYKSCIEMSDPTVGLVQDSVSNEFSYFSGITFTYETTDHYTTVISTDIMIIAPDFGFAIDTSKADTTPTDVPAARSKVNYSDCVKYRNWRKQ